MSVPLVTRVLIADDHPIVRTHSVTGARGRDCSPCVTTAIRWRRLATGSESSSQTITPACEPAFRRCSPAEPGIRPVGSLATAAEAWREVDAAQPDVVLVDPDSGLVDGLRLCFRVKDRVGGPSVVVYSAYADRLLAAPARIAQADALVSKTGRVEASSGEDGADGGDRREVEDERHERQVGMAGDVCSGGRRSADRVDVERVRQQEGDRHDESTVVTLSRTPTAARSLPPGLRRRGAVARARAAPP